MNQASLLQEILAPGGLHVFLQPIFRLGENPHIHAYECLVRGPASISTDSAELLFEYVRRERIEHKIDLICCELGLTFASRVPGEHSISVNVHASSLEKDPEFPEKLAELSLDRGVDPSRLIVEFLEYASNGPAPAVVAGIGRLRRFGMKVALDDVGSWQSNFKMMLDCEPEYLKIDRHFTQRAHSDSYRRAILSSVAHLARLVGAQVVAEGVEEQADLAVLDDLGIELAQGYLLARPMTPEFLMSEFLGSRSAAFIGRA